MEKDGKEKRDHRVGWNRKNQTIAEKDEVEKLDHRGEGRNRKTKPQRKRMENRLQAMEQKREERKKVTRPQRRKIELKNKTIEEKDGLSWTIVPRPWKRKGKL